MSTKRDVLSPEDVMKIGSQPFYKPGTPYQWVLAFGWVAVGFYIKHENPLKIRVLHTNYYQNAGKTHADLATQGASEDTSWRYMGERLISETSVLHVGEYFGKVPRSRVSS